MTEFFVLAQGAPAPAAAPAPTQTTNTTAPAPGGTPAPEQGALGGLMGMLPMILIIAAMFYLMWRGQAKERKKREAMLSSIKAGDRIVTIGGMYGTVVEVKNEGFIIKIADNVKIEVTKSAVGSVVTTGETAAK
ncbi:MAG: preprotein translocase subunit YajC [Victivallales bacterium]|jgi:preprotein translocase, yajC subunit